ncbi:hypothetical protein KPL78_04475 [Roseomonas sp. HJA6]|uniref:Sel1 repeat family protein n=1 Tax=Roseomonas alba TaxID=2846776 RepID=A0ABS7A469_9PROT|nr:hypothetical protein [Neoroseomonas alba]MBW6397089.1 hypothetical protein [Neoroseomonas alba]
MIAVRAAADPAHPEGGHAIILLQGVSAPPPDPRFRILREGWAKGTLGPEGWQVSDALIAPDRVEPSPQGVRLYLGPHVVDWLEAGPVQFRLPSAGIEAPLFWPDVPPLHGGSGHTIAVPPPAVRPAPPPLASPPPLPIDDPDATITMAPLRAAPPPPLSVPQPVSATKRAVWPWILLAVLLLASAGGGTWWWFYCRERPAPPAPEPTDPIEIAPEPLRREPPPPALPQPNPPPTLPPVRPQAEPQAPASLDGLTVAEVIERAASPAAIAEEASRRYETGRYDDALLLWEAAARAGNASALTRLARLYDPVGFAPGRPFRDPDPRQAARLYRDAVAGGDTAAAEPRARLRQWLDDRAREGDFNAPLTIRDFWP